MKLGYRFLFRVAGYFLLPQFIIGLASASAECEEPSTPLGKNTSIMLEGSVVKKTPGKKIAEMQVSLLSPQRIEAVLGKEGLNQLEGVNWEEVSSPNTDFESPSKRKLMRGLKTLCAKPESAEVEAFATELLILRDLILRVHSDRLVEHSKSYFETLFPNATISFRDKLNGNQLGTVVLIEQEGKKVAYYIKTHSGGIKKSESSPAEQVNPKELLTYALLDELHIGSEVHFYGRDKQHIYIGTKDMNVDGKFTEYSKLKERGVREIFGELTDLDFKKLTPNMIESIIAGDATAQNFIRQMFILDLVARLIRLTDLQTNGGNFGFVQPLEEGSFISLLKIIDFRLVAEKCFQRLNNGDWELFLMGEGFFEDNSDKRVKYILKDRDVGLRKRLARDIFQHEIAEWNNVMGAAVEKVKASINRLRKISDDDKTELFRKLDEDANVLIHNFNFFKAKLEVLD